MDKRLGYIDADLSELCSLGRNNPCNEWAIDITTPSPELHCDMPYDHEFLHGVPHIDIKAGKVWRRGFLDTLWVKDKSIKGVA